MNVQLSDLVGLHVFAENEGQRVTMPIIESNIPEELRPRQATVQAFIDSIFPDLCERLFEQYQTQSEIWAVASLPQGSTSSGTIDSGFISQQDPLENENLESAELDLAPQFSSSTAGDHQTAVSEGIGEHPTLSDEAVIQFQSFPDNNITVNFWNDVLQANFEPTGIGNLEFYSDASLTRMMSSGTDAAESQ